MDQNKYCESLTSYSRFITREVFIGEVPIGARNPIRIQSMTTTDTMDTNVADQFTFDRPNHILCHCTGYDMQANNNKY